MTLSFRHMADWNNGTPTIKVQISPDGSSWSNVWSLNPTADIPATLVTQSISFASGMSETTRIAFAITGSSDNIRSWYVDDLILSYENTLGSGTWTPAGSPYYPEGDVIIPNGHTLTLEPSVTVRFGASASLVVQGRLLSSGSSYGFVYLEDVGTDGWQGIEIENVQTANDSTLICKTFIEQSRSCGISILNSDKVRISDCVIQFNQVTGTQSGGGLCCVESDIILENCLIRYNASSNMGSAAHISGGSPSLRGNDLGYNYQYNAGETGSTLSLLNCTLDGIRGNDIYSNSFPTTAEVLTCAVYISGCEGDFERNGIYDNGSRGVRVGELTDPLQIRIINCNIVYNLGSGIVAQGMVGVPARLEINSCVVWGNSGIEVETIGCDWYSVLCKFCCMEAWDVSIDIEQSYSISGDPCFVDPAIPDHHLLDSSPCIDAGDPGLSPAPDLSIRDVGIYPRAIHPQIISAADVAPDQGHQVDLVWGRSDGDIAYQPGNFYSVWREEASRAADALYISDPSLLTDELLAGGQSIAWPEGDRTWYFLAQVPAVTEPDYGMIVPTLQDSSATGLHAAAFRVGFHNAFNCYMSASQSAWSVDNIPPLAPTGLALSPLAENSCQLAWEEVTEGIWEGNSYPETNQITYLIYASDTPCFEPGPDNFLLSTTELGAILIDQNAPRRFYRIVASDSQ
ncbi:MAG: right-handed parallel beta-helix repeat-containing protein [Candidatus Cloacimonetes bacterium]|nr:right-handed parallel beta-helix repeat-containing protein [Candidatus Cloacimonadota bacterium]